MKEKNNNEWIKEYFGVMDEGNIVPDDDLMPADVIASEKGRE